MAEAKPCFWESYDTLLDDYEGREAFRIYLEENALDFLLEFWSGVKGARLQTENGEEIQENWERRVCRKISKKYFQAQSEQDQNFVQFHHFPSDIMEEILQKHREKDFSLAMFDKAFMFTEGFMRNTCYPNFVQSQIYLDLVNSENKSDPPENVTEIPQSLSEDLVSTSVVEKAPLKKICENTELKTTTLTRRKPKEEIFDMSQVKINPNPYNLKEEEDFKRKDFEENQRCSTLKKYNPKLNYIPELDQTQTKNPFSSQPSSISGTLKRMPKKLSKHSQKTVYQIEDCMPIMSGRNPAEAYHATTSTLNTVTRQNSAFRSIATDASSAFSTNDTFDPEREQRQRFRQEKREIRTKANQNEMEGQAVKKLPKFLSNDEMLKRGAEKIVMYASNPKTCHKHAEILREKLNKYIEEQEKKEEERLKQNNFREFLRRAGQDRMSNPAESMVGPDNNELDEEILDSYTIEDSLESMAIEKRKFPNGGTLNRNPADGQTLINNPFASELPRQPSQHPPQMVHGSQGSQQPFINTVSYPDGMNNGHLTLGSNHRRSNFQQPQKSARAQQLELHKAQQERERLKALEMKQKFQREVKPTDQDQLYMDPSLTNEQQFQHHQLANQHSFGGRGHHDPYHGQQHNQGRKHQDYRSQSYHHGYHEQRTPYMNNGNNRSHMTQGENYDDHKKKLAGYNRDLDARTLQLHQQQYQQYPQHPQHSQHSQHSQYPQYPLQQHQNHYAEPDEIQSSNAQISGKNTLKSKKTFKNPFGSITKVYTIVYQILDNQPKKTKVEMGNVMTLGDVKKVIFPNPKENPDILEYLFLHEGGYLEEKNDNGFLPHKNHVINVKVCLPKS